MCRRCYCSTSCTGNGIDKLLKFYDSFMLVFLCDGQGTVRQTRVSCGWIWLKIRIHVDASLEFTNYHHLSH